MDRSGRAARPVGQLRSGRRVVGEPADRLIDRGAGEREAGLPVEVSPPPRNEWIAAPTKPLRDERRAILDDGPTGRKAQRRQMPDHVGPGGALADGLGDESRRHRISTRGGQRCSTEDAGEQQRRWDEQLAFIDAPSPATGPGPPPGSASRRGPSSGGRRTSSRRSRRRAELRARLRPVRMSCPRGRPG